MRVIWKRPDGFLGASPEDFRVMELEGHSRIWLHKTNKDQYPFQVAGGWEENADTVRLNNLVNLLQEPAQSWLEYLNHSFNHTIKDDRREYFDYLTSWLNELSGSLKGDTWEVEILDRAINTTKKRLNEVGPQFLSGG